MSARAASCAIPASTAPCSSGWRATAVLRGWHVLGVTASPLRGPKGNREFFLHSGPTGRTAGASGALIDRVAAEALA